MEKEAEQFILDVIENAKDLTLATVRQDGYPQATTVSYAHDGMTIYIGVGKDSQKIHNIRRNNKVSAAINMEYENWSQIQGISMGGTAEIIKDVEEIKRATDCMVKRFPELLEWTGSDLREDVIFLKIKPQHISILDYRKGFGHTELVTV